MEHCEWARGEEGKEDESGGKKERGEREEISKREKKENGWTHRLAEPFSRGVER